MTAKIISGTEIRAEILDEIKNEVSLIQSKHGVIPGLVTILIGDDPASRSYVTAKVKTATQLGFKEVQENGETFLIKEHDFGEITETIIFKNKFPI